MEGALKTCKRNEVFVVEFEPRSKGIFELSDDFSNEECFCELFGGEFVTFMPILKSGFVSHVISINYVCYK